MQGSEMSMTSESFDQFDCHIHTLFRTDLLTQLTGSCLDVIVIHNLLDCPCQLVCSKLLPGNWFCADTEFMYLPAPIELVSKGGYDHTGYACPQSSCCGSSPTMMDNRCHARK